MKRWFLYALAALMMLLPPGMASRAEAVPLDALLSSVPASAFQDGYLSYVDYEALLLAWPGADAPASPENDAYRNAIMGVRAGFGEMLVQLGLSQQVLTSSGFDPRLIRQSLEAGLPPRQQVWLQGGFNPQLVRRALGQQGYQRAGGEDGWALWCEGGNCENGARFDLKRRDPAFLFGGNLGRRWPVVLGSERLASSPVGEVIREIAAGSSSPLMDQPEIKHLLTSLRALPGGERVTQLMLFSPHTLLSTAELVTEANALAMAQLDAPDARRVVIALHFPLVAPAQNALRSLESRADTIIIAGREPLQTLLDDLGGTWELLRVDQAEGGAGVLVLSWQFPPPSAASSPASAHPFTRFANMTFRREMDWLLQ